MSPSRRTLGALGAWLAFSALAAFVPDALALWLLCGGALLGVLGLDLLLLLRTPEVSVEREVPASLAVGDWSAVQLCLGHDGPRALALTVFDHHPPEAETRGIPQTLRLAPGGPTKLEYRIYPTERGRFHFGRAELRIDSPLGFWRRRRRAGGVHEVRVYPNFRAVMKYNLLATDNRTSALGIRRRPRRGEGLDFHQLREYREGDTLRQIDWKVTMRLRKAISREYQDERDQQIVFLLDCGRKMHSRDDELSHFDHALDSVLLLAHVALRQGDAVGLLSFSGAERWLAPRKGASHLNRIMNSVYDLQTSTQASDYMKAAQELSKRVSKRALVVLISNLRDEEHEELLLAARLLARTHLVLLASLKERVLSEVLEREVRDFEAAIRTAATHQYLQARRRAHEKLRRTGVLCLDVEPQHLPVALVNGYLDIKRAGVL